MKEMALVFALALISAPLAASAQTKPIAPTNEPDLAYAAYQRGLYVAARCFSRQLTQCPSVETSVT